MSNSGLWLSTWHVQAGISPLEEVRVSRGMQLVSARPDSLYSVISSVTGLSINLEGRSLRVVEESF